MTLDSAWSSEAENARLYVPTDWPVAANDDETPPQCKFRWDVSRQLLLILDFEGEILDWMDPNDIIGVDVSIELFSSTEELRAHTTVAQEGFHNPPHDDDNNDDEPRSSIFETLDLQTIFHCNNQTPPSPNNQPNNNIPYDTQASAVLRIYAYPRRSHPPSWFETFGFSHYQPKPSNKLPTDSTTSVLPRIPHIRKLEVAPAEDFTHITALVQAIRGLAQLRRSKLLLVVNPKAGGSRNQPKLDTVLQILEQQAGMDVTVCLTQYAGHGRDRMLQDDIGDFTAILAMGGDGSLYELLQGLSQRQQQHSNTELPVLGILGCGTANGMAKSLAHATGEHCSLVDACFAIAKGHCEWIDLSRYTTSASTTYTSFLTFSWAMIADVDIESECMHVLGSLRFDVWAAWRCLFLRRYRAKFSYCLENDKKNATWPALTDPVPDHWTVLEDEFVLFWASHVTHAAENTHHTPMCQLQDGVFHILIVRHPISRYRLARILLGLENGTHVDMPGVEFIKCVAYRLEPMTPGSFNDLDGEVIESGPIQAHVLPKAARILCRPKKP